EGSASLDLYGRLAQADPRSIHNHHAASAWDPEPVRSEHFGSRLAAYPEPASCHVL
ncbi:MAG: hypothetical protein AVDCRST_MAG43-898, partial [uncultured Thermomicrobiales bacterium]